MLSHLFWCFLNVELLVSEDCSLYPCPLCLLMKSHAELNIGPSDLIRFWCLLSELICTSMEVATFQPSGFPNVMLRVGSTLVREDFTLVRGEFYPVTPMFEVSINVLRKVRPLNLISLLEPSAGASLGSKLYPRVIQLPYSGIHCNRFTH